MRPSTARPVHFPHGRSASGLGLMNYVSTILGLHVIHVHVHATTGRRHTPSPRFGFLRPGFVSGRPYMGSRIINRARLLLAAAVLRKYVSCHIRSSMPRSAKFDIVGYKLLRRPIQSATLAPLSMMWAHIGGKRTVHASEKKRYLPGPLRAGPRPAAVSLRWFAIGATPKSQLGQMHISEGQLMCLRSVKDTL